MGRVRGLRSAVVIAFDTDVETVFTKDAQACDAVACGVANTSADHRRRARHVNSRMERL